MAAAASLSWSVLPAPGTQVTFLSTGNPTGLKFTVEHGGRRVIFDFGLEHAPGRAPFSMGLEPRAGRELADLQAVGSAPAGSPSPPRTRSASTTPSPRTVAFCNPHPRARGSA